jgi:hypothetical protein
LQKIITQGYRLTPADRFKGRAAGEELTVRLIDLLSNKQEASYGSKTDQSS